MKHATRRIVAPLLLVALSPVGLAGGVPLVESPAPAPALQEARQENASDTERLNGAAQVLEAKGYRKEARRLREIAKDLSAPNTKRAKAKLKKAAKKLDSRAKKLLGRDIDERSTRIKMLDLLADGHAALGNDAAEKSLRFLASVGRMQEEGSDEQPVLPEALSTGEGDLMERLIRTIQSSERALAESGSKKAANAAKTLGEFYVKRESDRRAAPGATNVAPAPRKPEVGDFVTIEKRAPVLTLAASVHLGEKSDPAALQRLGWMAATAKARVTPEEANVPPVPDFKGMSQLIEDIDNAGRIFQRRGSEHEGQLCLTLAEYYRLRARGEINDDSATRRGAPAEPSKEVSLDLEARRDALEAQAADLREEIRRLRAELAEDGGRRK